MPRSLCADVVGDVADVGAEADHRRLVADVIDAAQRAGHGRAVAHVALDELGRRIEVVRAGGVGGGMQPVEDPHVVAAREQRVDDVRADEAGAAGDEHAAHRAATVRISVPVEKASRPRGRSTTP